MQDRHGNVVEYTYENAANAPIRLMRVESSDGRVITLGARHHGQQRHNEQHKLARDEAENLAEALGGIYEMRKHRTGILGAIFKAKDYADLSQSQLDLTIRWGIADIKWFRSTNGSHIIQTQGSLIRWNQVDWNRVDPGPGERWTPEQVLGRFFRMVEAGAYP